MKGVMQVNTMRYYKEYHMIIKNRISLLLLLAAASCKPVVKLSVPEVFAKQATAFHVQGSHKNKMTVGPYSTSRIKRGINIGTPTKERHPFFDNLVLNMAGIEKKENTVNEKAKFRYALFNANNKIEVYGQEKKVTRSTSYSMVKNNSFINGIEQVDHNSYVFSAIIKADSLPNPPNWELLMTNLYDRDQDTAHTLFPLIRPEEMGVATNGTDSIFIKSISLQHTTGKDGKERKLPFKMLSGYELSTPDGVVAIIDLFNSDVWLYNELEEKERLILTGITTALLARKVNNTKW
jgi:hypothetical protein